MENSIYFIDIKNNFSKFELRLPLKKIIKKQTMKHLTLITLFFVVNIAAAQENSPLTCSDGIDNDGDGLIDCLDNECATLPNNGCSTCFKDGFSFADFVIEYSQDCPSNIQTNPENAIGVSNFVDGYVLDEYVSLGSEGYIKLGFDNNLLTNSGDNSPDLWVFEIGEAVEASQIDLKPSNQNTINILTNEGIQDIDSDGYFEFDIISGSTSSLDIDAYVIGYSPSELKFDAVKITNATNRGCGNETTPGADIDAVCALSSIEVDCTGTPNGTAQIDECGECLQPTNPNFNQSCIDCTGAPNGTAQIDECGECLQPTNPNFNQACIDCAGAPNGIAQIDECGECLQPTNPNFSQSCIDCAGILNGTAQIDECGECLQPTNPSFSQSCIDCTGTPNGTAQIDECGECLQPTNPNFSKSCIDCEGILNGTAKIDKCGECLQPTDPSFDKLCIQIPNAFSPNNDGVNDYFRIFAREETSPTIKLYQIYNRWGQLIHEKKNFSLHSNNSWWAGKDFKGRNVGIGVYTYYISVVFKNTLQRDFKGNVTVVK